MSLNSLTPAVAAAVKCRHMFYFLAHVQTTRRGMQSTHGEVCYQLNINNLSTITSC